MLNESCGQMEWSLKHQCDLKYVMSQKCCQQTSRAWVLQDVSYNFFRDCFPNNQKEAPMEEKYEWDSDNDNILEDKS
uniref:Uncharacterized protein n=1 Tax=Arundo donax TaxID=35708 RepID=A0A0A9AXM0_ARUDO